MTAADELTERASHFEQRIAASAARVGALRDALADELATRDALIVEAVDTLALSERRAAKAAGFAGASSVRDVLARSG